MGTGSRAGVTLLELMFTVGLMTVVLGMLFALATGLGDATQTQAAKTTANDEVRRAMIYIARDIRQASKASLSALPAATLTYSIATDVDGNGTAVDIGGYLETSAPGPSSATRRTSTTTGRPVTSLFCGPAPPCSCWPIT